MILLTPILLTVFAPYPSAMIDFMLGIFVALALLAVGVVATLGYFLNRELRAIRHLMETIVGLLGRDNLQTIVAFLEVDPVKRFGEIDVKLLQIGTRVAALEDERG